MLARSLDTRLGVRLWSPVPVLASLLMLIALWGGRAEAQVRQDPPSRPTFRAGVEVVTISAVVRDRRGRFVPGLTREDFQVFDRGQARRIAQFRADEAPISVALLVDVSGSMDVGGNLARAREAAGLVLAGLDHGRDEAALFTFDTTLRDIQPFTADPRLVLGGFADAAAFGATRLHDAIAATAQRVAARANHRRAIVVLTDGVDNASRLTPADVSGIASEIDVPVYVVTVVSPLDRPDVERVMNPMTETDMPAQGTLGDLARWTGGEIFVASAVDELASAAREIVAELRHQYLLSFEPAAPPGWHPLVVRTRHKNLIVHARGGYVAGPAGSE